MYLGFQSLFQGGEWPPITSQGIKWTIGRDIKVLVSQWLDVPNFLKDVPNCLKDVLRVPMSILG